jgi:hypothetical protein
MCKNNIKVKGRDEDTFKLGPIEVCSDGMKRLLCADERDDEHQAMVTCRHLFPESGTHMHTHNIQCHVTISGPGYAKGFTFHEEVAGISFICDGDEERLLQCTYNGTQNCNKAGVLCCKLKLYHSIHPLRVANTVLAMWPTTIWPSSVAI